jgi:acyl-CoA synthetase (AMP-forming)/AMP-acid ligase II
MEVVETMENAGFTANSAAAIYDECNIVWNGFQEISIEHLSRKANQVAHELARQAMISRANYIWDDDPWFYCSAIIKRCNYIRPIKLAYGLL